MKRVLILFALLMPTAALAQTSQAQKDIMSDWVSMIVTKRIKTEWTPKLYAAPATAAELGSVAGISVASDPAMKERVLQLRNAEPFPDKDQFTQQPIIVPADSVMAERLW